MSDEIEGCPVCGKAPDIATLGSCIDIECCVSRSVQKCDVLQDILDDEGDGRRWSDIPRGSEPLGDFEEGYAEKILQRAIEEWNTRLIEGELERQLAEAKAERESMVTAIAEQLVITQGLIDQLAEAKQANLRQRVEDIGRCLGITDGCVEFEHCGTFEIVLHETFGGSVCHLIDDYSGLSIKDVVDYYIEYGAVNS